MEFDWWAGWSYERLIIMQPHIRAGGLWRVGSEYYAVCPGFGSATTIDGDESLQNWFDYSCRAVTAPIRLADAAPAGAEQVGTRTAEELALLVGEPVTTRDAYLLLHLALPKDFPRFAVSDAPGRLIVRVCRPLGEPEFSALRSVVERQRMPGGLNVQIDPRLLPGGGPPLRTPGQGDTDLTPSRSSRTWPLPVREAVEADDDFWSSSRASILATCDIANPRQVLPAGFERPGAACLVNVALFPAENIRNYLCLYDTVTLVAPIAEYMVENCRALGVTPAELADLAALGRVRIVLPHAIDRYDPSWIALIAEKAPTSLLLSRRLAAATVVATRRRWPLLFPALGIAERRQILDGFTTWVGNAPQSPVRDWLLAIRNGLSRSWAGLESGLTLRGASGTPHAGIGAIAAELLQVTKGKDFSLEMWSAGGDVQWAAALGATLFPVRTASYSEENAARLAAAMLGAPARDRVPSVLGPDVHSVLDGVLSIDNDIPVLEFARDFGAGDVRRLRDFVLKMAAWNQDPEFLSEAIRRFNSEVRRVERNPDRLRTLNVVSLVPALLTATLPAAGPELNEVKQFGPLGAWMASMVLQVVAPGAGASSALLGRMLDFANGMLAGANADAVLVARVKKEIKILKG